MTAQQPPWFVFAGGGTGGHLYPGVAAAGALRQLSPHCRITFFASDRAIDAQILRPAGLEMVTQAVRPFRPRPTQWWAFLRAYRRSVVDARRRFAENPPRVVLSLGGFAGVPAVVAARRLRVPTAVFNPDARPGRANRRLIRRADAVFAQWDETFHVLNRSPKVKVTGCPVRPEFLTATREEGCRAFGLDAARNVLLITGASQGAANVNRAAIELIDFFASMPDWQIVLLTGAGDFEPARAEFAARLPGAQVLDFTPRMATAMAAADLVLCRAGASTLAELTALGRPAVLMPYPYDRRQHQRANAQILAQAQAAMIVEDQKDAAANARALRPVLRDLMTSHERRRRMGRSAKAIGRTDAAETLAAALLELAGAAD